MSYNQFFDMVCESLGLDSKVVDGTTSFINDLGIDSLSLANFIIKLERQYAIKFDLTNVWELKNIREAYDRFTQAMAIAQPSK
jgi:acyl carrier protein